MSCWVTVEGKKNVELSRLRLRQPECDGQARDPPLSGYTPEDIKSNGHGPAPPCHPESGQRPSGG